MKKILLLLLYFCCVNGFAFERAFYVLRNEEALPDLKDHHHQIDILIAQSYRIDQNGQVNGYIDNATLQLAKQKRLRLMAMVTNVGFNRIKAHQFLANERAQTKALTTLLTECKKHHVYGVQFDFEGVSMYDRTALTHFYVRAAKLFHASGFKISYAVVAITDLKLISHFSKKQYRNWSGAYDYFALGKYGDFVSVMAYDQHSQGTTPGPSASIRWVESTIGYALRDIPKEKLSLGIPVYSGYWHTGYKEGRIKVHLSDKRFDEIKALAKRAQVKLSWDLQNKIHYAFYDRNWLNVYLFVEDARSFQAKLALVKKYHLRGISVFNLGSEDPTIWTLLKGKKYAYR